MIAELDVLLTALCVELAQVLLREDTETFFAAPDLGLTLIRPAAGTKRPRVPSRTGCASG